MGKFTEYKVPLKSLNPGVSTFEYHLGKEFFANMENPDIHDADIKVALTVTLKGDIYDLHFDITGTYTLLCDRCLDALVMPVETTFDIAVEYGDDYNDDSDTLLIIPSSSPALNVAYMLHDTVALTIPIKHVHPLGKCNRAMSSLLKKHRATSQNEPAADSDEELMEELIDQIDTMPAQPDEKPDEAPTDPRWDALKGLKTSDSADEAGQ